MHALVISCAPISNIHPRKPPDGRNMMQLRNLGPGEELWARSSQKTSNNFLMVMQLTGKVNFERFADAFQLAISLYPILGANVVELDGKLKLQFGLSAQTKLQCIPRVDAEHWQEIAEQELNQHLPVLGSRLWQATLLLGDEDSELILTFNHILGDGKSGVNLLQSLLAIYTGQLGAQPRLPSPAVNKLMNQRPISWTRLKNLSRFVNQSIKDRKEKVYTLPSAVKNHEGYGRTELLSEALEPELGNFLQKAARSHGTTVHGVICAALLMALREFSQEPRQNLGVASAVNLRTQLPQQYERDFGFFVGSVELVRAVDESTDIWSLASSLSQALKDDVAAERPLFDGFLRSLILKKFPDFDEAAAIMRANSKSTVHITNLGRIEFPNYEGSLQVKHCFHVPSCHFLSRPYLVLACVTMNQVMKLNFTFPVPFVERPQAARIVERFKAILSSLQTT